MKSRLVTFGVLVVSASVLLGARGCTVWADTDQTSYEAGSAGTTTLHNESGETVFLPGCSAFTLEKKSADGWIDIGPLFVCFWEGYAVPVPTGQSHTDSLNVPRETGTWRVRFFVSYGCKEGVPLSQAECSREERVTTPAFEVVEPPALTCGDWMTAYAAEVETVTACQSADDCMSLRGTSCGCTRDLVVNKNADLESFWKAYNAMAEAGCGIATTCDCPEADGFVCADGRCAWNYK